MGAPLKTMADRVEPLGWLLTINKFSDLLHLFAAYRNKRDAHAHARLPMRHHARGLNLLAALQAKPQPQVDANRKGRICLDEDAKRAHVSDPAFYPNTGAFKFYSDKESYTLEPPMILHGKILLHNSGLLGEDILNCPAAYSHSPPIASVTGG
jgi:hypothetical protein